MRRVALVLALSVAALGMPRAATAQQRNANLVAKGAALYGKNCARCHNLRSPTEFTDLAWRTIIAQMRARANLTRDEARAILAFVQATNGVGSADGATTTMGPRSEKAPAAKGTAPKPTVDQVAAGLADPSLDPAVRKALRRYMDRLRSGRKR